MSEETIEPNKMSINERERIESHIAKLEREIEEQQNKKYTCWTSNNIVIIVNRIFDLQRQLNTTKLKE